VLQAGAPGTVRTSAAPGAIGCAARTPAPDTTSQRGKLPIPCTPKGLPRREVQKRKGGSPEAAASLTQPRQGGYTVPTEGAAPAWRNGRRKRLKIARATVWVRLPPPALSEKTGKAQPGAPVLLRSIRSAHCDQSTPRRCARFDPGWLCLRQRRSCTIACPQPADAVSDLAVTGRCWADLAALPLD
jgi:hypothetical protein